MKRIGLISLLALATAQAAAAQTSTEIQPDTDPARSLGTTVTIGAQTFTIKGGRRSGNNLFHSFATFTLGEGDTARWVHSAGDPASLSNIINRVTGGDPSRIFGTIDSTEIPNANFYFINPAGIIFGAGAQINVPAAAHFSTASAIRFADGQSFAISTPGGSTLSMASPQSFGFLGGEAGITVTDAEDGFLSPDAELTLSGSDVRVSDSIFDAGGLSLFATGFEGGTVDVHAGPEGELAGSISITDSFISLRPSGRADGGARIVGGDVTLSGSDLIALAGEAQAGGDVSLTANSATFNRQAFLGTSTRTGQDAGAITVRAGDLDLFGGSQIFSRSRGDGRSGLVTIASNTISLNRSFVFSDVESGGSSGGVAISAGELLLFRSSITANASSDSSGDAGDIRIVADDLQLFTLSAINSDAGGTGTGGTISLQATTLGLSGESSITADTLIGSEGAGGRIEIAADTLIVEEESFVTADTFGAGPAGSVSIDASDVLLDTGGFIASNALRGSQGAAGSVELRADTLTLLNESRLSASTFSVGDAGNISVTAGTILLDGFSRIVSQANPGSSGNAGLVSIEAGRLDVLNESEIATSTFSSGDAGLLAIKADTLFADRDAFIGSLAGRGSTGDAGLVLVEAGTLDLRNGTRLATTTFGQGDAGAVIVKAGTARLAGEVFISSSATEESTGDAGGVSIEADVLELLDGSEVASSTFSVGAAGIVSIEAGELAIGGFSFLGSNSNPGASGDAGLVTVSAGTLRVYDRGRIATSTFGVGRAGDILIAAGSINLDNAFIGSTANVGSSGDAGTITIVADEIVAAKGTRITSNASFDTSGDAGEVSITATGELSLLDGSQISSDTFGGGDAGGIEVEAGSLSLFDRSSITSDTLGPGTGGSVSVVATDMVVASGSSVSSNATVCADGSCGATGSAGIVSVRADTLLLTGGGRIASDTLSDGDAGLVIVEARELTIEDGGRISSESRACEDGTCLAIGDAGGVFVTAEVATLRSGGQISSSTDGTGDAGLVFVRGGEFTLAGGSSIQSAAREGSSGSAGAVDIELLSAFRASQEAFVTSSTLGQGDAGDVSITAPLIDLSSGAFISSSSAACPNGNCVATGDAGSVQLTADNLILDRAFVTSSTAGEGDAGFVTINAHMLTMASGEIASRASEGSTGIAGQVQITAATIDLSQGALVTSDTAGSGNAGGVSIEAGELFVSSEARVSSSTMSAGNAGVIDIDARDVDVSGGGSIFASSSGSGAGGSVLINADRLNISDGGRVEAQSQGSGDAGDVQIEAAEVSVVDGGGITVNTDESGRGGQVMITADRVNVSGGFISSDTFGSGRAGGVLVDAQDFTVGAGFVSSDTNGSGNGGAVVINAQQARIIEGGVVSSATSGEGLGGNVSINARNLTVASGGAITTDTRFACDTAGCGGRGQGGTITIVSDTLAVNGTGPDGLTFISADALASADAGSVVIRANDIQVTNSAFISSQAFGSEGDAGSVTIEAGRLAVTSNGFISSDSRVSSGDAGLVQITARDILLEDGGAIQSRAIAEDPLLTGASTGNAGRVRVRADSINASRGGRISSSTAGLGNAGDVTLEVGTIQLDSGANISSQSERPEAGRAGFVQILGAQALRLDNGAFVSSSTFGAGDAGGVLIDARTVDLDRGALIASQAGRGSTGEAGLVEIEANSVRVAGGASINTSTFSNRISPGEGSGAVGIFADTVSVTGGGDISSGTFSSDNAGVVLILARQVTVDNGSISSAAREGSTGQSGDVAVEARERLLIANGGAIATSSANDRTAGRLAIRAGDLRVDGAESEITSSNSSAQGAAGQIEIVQLDTVPGGGITLSEGASITTSARGGEAGTIDISMTPGSILRLNGRNATSRIDTSSTGGGSGGQVTIGNPDTGVGNPFAVILNGGTITALGGLDAAFLSVNADYIIRSADRFNAIRIGDNQEVALGEYDVSSGITAKDVDVIDASRVLRGQCPAARASGQLSQFTFQPVGPYAASPHPSSAPKAALAGSPEGGCF